MGFIYGLAVVLVIFEGIIIQCEGVGDSGGAGHSVSSDRKQLAETFATKDGQIHSSNEKIAEIVKEFDSEDVPKNDPVISNILKHHIIEIGPYDQNMYIDSIHEQYKCGDLLLQFHQSKELDSFVEKFGDQIKNIKYIFNRNAKDVRRKVIRKIIKQCSKSLEEFAVETDGHHGFWKDINLLDEKDGFTFPEVKKLVFEGAWEIIPFELKTIFPKLIFLELDKRIYNVDFLKNVNELTELALPADNIQEHKLVDIFSKNGKMKKIRLYDPVRAETMHSISSYLTELETLEVDCPGKAFLFGSNSIHKLPHVTHFNIRFKNMNEASGFGKHSFQMPKLQKLTFNGNQTDDGIINFINNFNGLDKLEIFVKNYDTFKCIQELQNVREFVTTFGRNRNAETMVNMLIQFHKNSKLQILKFVNLDVEYYCQNFKNATKGMNQEKMENFNKILKEWTLSYEQESGIREKTLVFSRVK